ncbi:MAG TPA: phenylalanine--tRNA ligase subunit beta [Candidatus Rikenella faecigallinarum]|uniref:Phenylalanine--tRNA ligase beta subunit n=1 Tax=Candidatus Rikenella faecigallinarum TaxID=2838745 RepID=A0A9D1QDL1_9BACT|nr:phenylalanine--tRNA ligase subunit beta [Candidatus Rikenella faecigallinarum]
MKIAYNWLKDYVKTDLTAEEAAAILTAAGLEIEGIEKVETIRGGLQGLVVAEVLTCTDHPDSDHLHVTTVSTGEGTEPLQVVCGAPNVAAGQKVILAQIGTTLYPTGEEEGFKIKKSKIRGVESFGMLCAEDEIGVGTAHDGIIVLDPATKVGTPAAEVFHVEDEYVFEVGLTPNRIDAASHYGVARDLAAYLTANGTPTAAALADVSAFRVDDPKALPVTVRVEDPAGAPRYMGVTVKGVKIGPSPEWLQKRLHAIGLNPKNNVVDITNFVMFECGEPLHAFDMAKVAGHQIIVKRAQEGEPFTTLDGVEHKLSAEDLMICNAERPMCLAGVFGGLDSGVSDTTTDVFIEAAYFNPVTVRKSARRHGLSTDSSFRFERGTDPDMPAYALRRAALLMKELAGGTIASEVVDIYPEKIGPFEFSINLGRINRLIGADIPAATAKAILTGLEIEIRRESVAENGDTLLDIAVPVYRVDVQREADIAEEILRIYGFNNVPNPHHIKNVITYGNQKTPDRIINTASDLLVGQGCVEIMSNSLTRSAYYDELTAYPAAHCVRIINPLSNELNVMRQTLLFNALEAVALNVNRRNGDLRLFEFGNCYFFDPAAAEQEGAKGTLKPYREERRLAITVTGLEHQPNWNRPKPQPSDFFTVKYLTEQLLQRFGVNIYEGYYETLSSDLYSEAVSYKIRGKQLFEMGVVSSKLARKTFDLKQPVYFMEMNVAHLQKIVETVRVQAVELSKYPEVKRDLALLVDKEVTFSQLREAASKAEKKLLKSVGLFDVYEGDKLPEGKKSYALSFVIEDTTKTLTDTEIDRIMTNIAAALTKATGAQVRS